MYILIRISDLKEIIHVNVCYISLTVCICIIVVLHLYLYLGECGIFGNFAVS